MDLAKICISKMVYCGEGFLFYRGWLSGAKICRGPVSFSFMYHVNCFVGQGSSTTTCGGSGTMTTTVITSMPLVTWRRGYDCSMT